MKLVVQRVKDTKLFVDGKLVSEIGKGLVAYLGVESGDDISHCQHLAKKLAHMRIFEDEAGKMNLSAVDLNCEILAVSQFTLCADTKHGNRPSFTQAEIPSKAQPLYDSFVEILKNFGLEVKTGIFGADMTICQTNDGPVTIFLETSR